MNNNLKLSALIILAAMLAFSVQRSLQLNNENKNLQQNITAQNRTIDSLRTIASSDCTQKIKIIIEQYEKNNSGTLPKRPAVLSR